ncbi:hypothetical protein ACIGW3_26090 [Streptomyces sp. NPDC053499]|uniref:hypothetical protein n=1 Tax=Streptomyces sp. NPDC053499 TaxID=3365707 RepID=UPI0037D3314C
MTPGLAPTIGGNRPGSGLRIRFDHKNTDLASADFSCRCGHPAEDAIGGPAVQQLVVRAERHMRDDCPLPDIRRAAAHRDAARRRLHESRRK